jgi:L,D-transpeptidase-like protein
LFVLKGKLMGLPPAHLAVAVLAAFIGANNHASATDNRSERSVEPTELGMSEEPIMAIVGANGVIVRAPVSSGQRGRETPAGIFSIIQKQADHYSNLYDDAYMPHMQRITWSGIALHGGVLPGHAASHGCIRMPFEFAANLFDATRLGLRVIVAPNDVAPVEIAHPILFPAKPIAADILASRLAEADEAAKKANQASLLVRTALREAAEARVPVRVAEAQKLRAEAHLAAAETSLNAAPAEAREAAERARTEVVAKIAALEVQLTAAKAGLQLKLDAVGPAREAAELANSARAAAAESARQVTREQEPVSVLISRKTQRLYVRQAFEPIFESSITILDPDRPVGTYVFTAVDQIRSGTNMRWSVVSLEGGDSQARVLEAKGRTRSGHRADPEPMLTDAGAAKAALDRIVIPQDVLDRIAGMTPRSSLIVTDEPLSSETGQGTDFVVLLSGEPQGGIKTRRRAPVSEFGYARSRDRLHYWRSPFAGPFSTW